MTTLRLRRDLSDEGTDWDQASCKGADVDLFFPERGTGTAIKDQVRLTVSQYCNAGNGCPIKGECEYYALTHPGVQGIWGGHFFGVKPGVRERRRMEQALRRYRWERDRNVSA